MAKTNTSTQAVFREILASVKSGKFANVYIFMGDEPYYIDALTKVLETAVVPEEDRDFNSKVFYGADADLSVVIASAQQYPVMPGRQLVVLKEAQALTKAKTALEVLAPYVGRPNPSTVFVLVFKGDTLSSASALMKMAKKSDAVVFTSMQLKDYQLAAPIKEYCSSRGVGIDDKATALLCDHIGNPLSKLFGEIDKLIVAAGGDGKTTITPELIETNIGISKDFNNFELTSAISRKDYVKAVRIIDYFSKNPKENPTSVTAAVIYSYFVKLVSVIMLPDRSDGVLMQVLNAKSVYQLNDIKEGMRVYSPRQAVNAVHHVRDFDVKSKGVGSMQNSYELLRELIFKIFT